LFRNLAEELVKEGLATVMNNPRDDQMSQCFDDLKKAEEIAKQSHKGLYSKSSPPKQRITDCSSAAVSNINFVQGEINVVIMICMFRSLLVPRLFCLVSNVSQGLKLWSSTLPVVLECVFTFEESIRL